MSRIGRIFFLILPLLMLTTPLSWGNVTVFDRTALIGAHHAWGQSRFQGIADVTVTGAATLIRDTNGTRVSLVCTNTSSTVHMRVGGSGVTITSGVQVRAAATITLTGPYAIYGISEGANITTACSEELR